MSLDEYARHPVFSGSSIYMIDSVERRCTVPGIREMLKLSIGNSKYHDPVLRTVHHPETRPLKVILSDFIDHQDTGTIDADFARVYESPEDVPTVSGKTRIDTRMRDTVFVLSRFITAYIQDRREDYEYARLPATVDGLTCMICFDPFPAHTGIYCSNWSDHGICRGCFREYVDQNSSAFPCNIRCVVPSCGNTYTSRVCRENVSAEKRMRYTDIRNRRIYQEACDTVECHNCRQVQLSGDGSRCKHCGFVTCDEEHNPCPNHPIGRPCRACGSSIYIDCERDYGSHVQCGSCRAFLSMCCGGERCGPYHCIHDGRLPLWNWDLYHLWTSLGGTTGDNFRPLYEYFAAHPTEYPDVYDKTEHGNRNRYMVEDTGDYRRYFWHMSQ